MKPLLIRTTIMPYESLSSLVFRLTQANVYDCPGRIYGLIDLPPTFRKNISLLSDYHVLKKISFINRCSEGDVFRTTLYHFAKFFSYGKDDMLDSYSMNNFALHSRTQYCPLCLKESNYHRLYWDLLPITICIRHKIILQQICQKCYRPVKVDWVLRNKCKCGEDLLSVNPVSIASYQDVISNQSLIQDILEIRESAHPKRANENYKLPLSLSTPDFFKLLKHFTVILNKLPTSSKFLKVDNLSAKPYDWMTMKNNTSGFTNFIFFHSAVSILLDWPQKFYEFLDDYRKVEHAERARHRSTGVQKDFAGLRELLLDKLPPVKFGFVHSAYSDYLSEQWTGGHLSSNIKYLNIPHRRPRKRYITVDEAAKILGIGDIFVPRFVEYNLIQAVVLKTGTKKRYLIDAGSIYALKRKVDKMLTSVDLAERLDVSNKTVKSLVKNGLLFTFKINPWSSAYSYLFEPKEVERFEKEFLSEERYTTLDKRPDGYLQMIEAVKRISNAEIDTARLLHLVKNGTFCPILCKEGKDLSRLLFSEIEIKKYRDAYTESKRDNNELSIYRISILLGIDMRLVQHIINIGLITVTVKFIDGGRETYVQNQDFEKFKSEYAFIDEAAILMGFDKETVFQWIKQGRLKDYSQIPITKRSGIRVLRREEIKPLIPENSMGILEATEYLGLPPESIYDLIHMNILPTLKGKGLGKTPFHRIPRQEVVLYKENFLKPVQEKPRIL